MSAVKWRARLAEHPTLRDMGQWPQIPMETVPRRFQTVYLRNQMAVAQVLGGESVGRVASAFGMSGARVSQLLQRCLGGEADEPPALMAGLVPHKTLLAKARRSPLSRLDHRSGHPCAFRGLLDAVPGLREGLDAAILADLKDTAHAQKLTPLTFHALLKRLLVEAHWPGDRYPYSTVSLGYYSARRYLKARRLALAAVLDARRAQGVGRRPVTPDLFRALRAVQIDAHELDVMNRIELDLNGELIPLRIKRCTVLVAIDVDTRCILGYVLVPGEPNQQDLLALIDVCLSSWQPLALTTPGFAYTPGAVFPNGLPEAYPISFGLVQFDNAYVHQALSVQHLLCEEMGATLHFGLPGTPQTRALVESVFDYIGTHATHRFAATTGNAPNDPRRESPKLRKTPPLASYRTLNEALSLILTNANVQAHAAFGGISPLELFRYQCEQRYVRYVPPEIRRQWQPFLSDRICTLQWYRHEGRQPHVQAFYQRYQGPGLLRAAATGAGKIRIRYDRRDMRTVHAYSLQGEDLGVLQVTRPWQRFPHSLALRQRIQEETRAQRFRAEDPLTGYFQHLLTQRESPTGAQTLLRVYTEFTGGLMAPLALGEPPPQEAPAPPRVASSFQWHTSMANHKEAL